MLFDEMISKASEQLGSKKAVSIALGIDATNLSHAMKGVRRLPDFACFRLAELIGINPAEVIAASALITEKDEEKRKVFYPFVMAGKSATIATIALLGVAALTTPRPASAHSMPPTSDLIHIMSTLRRIRPHSLKVLGFMSLECFFSPFRYHATKTI
jgi:DNA-binding transcriptional regulator YdaS (Cro superfamily)